MVRAAIVLSSFLAISSLVHGFEQKNSKQEGLSSPSVGAAAVSTTTGSETGNRRSSSEASMKEPAILATGTEHAGSEASARHPVVTSQTQDEQQKHLQEEAPRQTAGSATEASEMVNAHGENLQHTASTHSPLLNGDDTSSYSAAVTGQPGEKGSTGGRQYGLGTTIQRSPRNTFTQESSEQGSLESHSSAEQDGQQEASLIRFEGTPRLPKQQKRTRNYLHGVLPVVEVDSPPDRFPVTSPNVSDKDWFQFHVKGTPKLITMFSGECNAYFDWQTLGMFYSFKRSGQPGRILRLLACSEQDLAKYQGLNLCPTLVAPSWNTNPRTGDHYSAINKPVGVQYWLDHGGETLDTDWVLILDADQILRAPIVPWELGAEKGRIVAAPYTYLIGCDNILADLHLKRNKRICDQVGGVLGMTVGDARVLAPWWINKTEEVRADTDHYATNITGDIYGKGWISEMYGYSFGASEVGLRHVVNEEMMLYPGYIPIERVDPRLLHYGLPITVSYNPPQTLDMLNWTWAKFSFRNDVAFTCGAHFPDPPDITSLRADLSYQERRRDLLSIELVAVLNRALREHHRKIGCDPKEEQEVGIMDINGGGLSPSGAPWVDIWRGKASANLQAATFPHLTPRMGVQERETAFELHAMNRMVGNRHAEMVGVEKGLYVERVSGKAGPQQPAVAKKKKLDPKPAPLNLSASTRSTDHAKGKASPLIDLGVGSVSVGGKPKAEWKQLRKGGAKESAAHLAERRRALFRSATAEKLFADFGSTATTSSESSHMAMLLSLSMGMVVGMIMLFTVARMFFWRRRKGGKIAHRLKRDGVRKARLLDL